MLIITATRIRKGMVVFSRCELRSFNKHLNTIKSKRIKDNHRLIKVSDLFFVTYYFQVSTSNKSSKNGNPDILPLYIKDVTFSKKGQQFTGVHFNLKHFLVCCYFLWNPVLRFSKVSRRRTKKFSCTSIK